MPKYIKVNAIECLECHKYLLSLSHYDYRACRCGALVDGGFDYWRRGQGPNGIQTLNLYVKKGENLYG